MIHSAVGNSSNKILYINKVDISGWVNVRLKSGILVPVLKYTKVQVSEVNSKETWFTVLDGAHKGKLASMSAGHAKEYLGSKAPLQTGALLVVKYQKMEVIHSIARNDIFTQQTASLTIDGIHAQVTLNTKLEARYGTFTPLPAGFYKIGLPQNPHDKSMTEFYRRNVQHDLKNDQVWFPIKYGNNSRFVHVGNVSEGCVTVMSLDKWNAIHEALIRHRIPGTNYIGQVMISK